MSGPRCRPSGKTPPARVPAPGSPGARLPGSCITLPDFGRLRPAPGVLLLLLIAAVWAPARLQAAPLPEPTLQERLEQLVAGFHGTAGLYVRHLRTGETAAVNADSLFPTASMVKVPILCGLFDRIERGELSYDSVLTYRDSLLYPGVDILGSFRDSARIPLSEVTMLMASLSDNTASLWCQHLAGTGTAVNAWLERQGLQATRVNSRTPGRAAEWEQWGWGVTTPREMAGLLVMIREGRAVSPAASAEMYRVLGRSYWDAEALSQIPPWVRTASKQGAVDASRSEVFLVNAPTGDYAACVITRDQADTRWTADNEGAVLIRAISRLLWQHFVSAWEPPPGAGRWRK